MSRPCKLRSIQHDPSVRYFKPRGVPLRELSEVRLGLDELEALRLGDLEGLSHQEIGERMGVSRATAGRILAAARSKTAEALVHGLAIRLAGGPVQGTGSPDEPCCCADGPKCRHDGWRGRSGPATD